ncbi:hypothetical protein AB205_0050020 [Aquarana catesbeiana]|nr:hypothetical protein AB205_0050020 [Aquarana catesbeiana]
MFHIHISVHKYLCAKYTFCFILIGEKRLAPSEDTRNPPPPEEVEQSIVVPQDPEEGEMEEVLEFGTTTGDVQVVVPKPVISPVTLPNRLSRKSCFVVVIWTLSKKKPRRLNKD